MIDPHHRYRSNLRSAGSAIGDLRSGKSRQIRERQAGSQKDVFYLSSRYNESTSWENKSEKHIRVPLIIDGYASRTLNIDFMFV